MLRKTGVMVALWAGLAVVVPGAAAETAQVATPSGTVSFELPEGYRELTAQELAAKFGRHGRVPLRAYGNATRSSTVAVTWSEMKQRRLTQQALPQLKGAMTDLMPKLTPGLEFQETAMVTIGSQDWVLLRSTAPAVDTTVVNHMYLTDVGGHMVGVNYNATDTDYPGQQAGFEKSAKTLAAQAAP